MQFGIVLVLVIGWSLVLAQPFFSARKRKDYLRSIVAFRQQLIALETGIQSRPSRGNVIRPTRAVTSTVTPYQRRQRTLASLAISLLIGLILTVVAAPVGIVLTTISLVSIAVFLTLARASHSVVRSRPPYSSQRQVVGSSVSSSERAIA